MPTDSSSPMCCCPFIGVVVVQGPLQNKISSLEEKISKYNFWKWSYHNFIPNIYSVLYHLSLLKAIQEHLKRGSFKYLKCLHRFSHGPLTPLNHCLQKNKKVWLQRQLALSEALKIISYNLCNTVLNVLEKIVIFWAVSWKVMKCPFFKSQSIQGLLVYPWTVSCR